MAFYHDQVLDRLLADTRIVRNGAKLMQLGDRSPMRGFAFVDALRCDDEQLKGWVSNAAAHILALPAKVQK